MRRCYVVLRNGYAVTLTCTITYWMRVRRIQKIDRVQYDSAESYPPQPWPVPDRYPSWSRNCGENQMRGSKPMKMKNTELEPCILESSARLKKHACLFGLPKFPLEMELSDMRSRVAGLRHRCYHRQSWRVCSRDRLCYGTSARICLRWSCRLTSHFYNHLLRHHNPEAKLFTEGMLS